MTLSIFNKGIPLGWIGFYTRKGRVQKKKNSGKFHKGRGAATADFPLKKKNMGLKHWILPNNHFKTHLFFSIFGWGGPFSAWILVGRVAQTSKLSGEAIWQVSEDPYHTEFVSWRVDHFSFFYFFPLMEGVRRLVENSTNFFFLNPSLSQIQDSKRLLCTFSDAF